MDALKAEIERKRKAKQELTGGKKWMRKGDLERLEAERYREAQRAKTGEPAAGSSEADASRPAAPEAAPGGAAEKVAEGVLPSNALPDLEVKKRLRALQHPIMLFDETVVSRWFRYTKVEGELRESQAAANSELRRGQLFNERQLDERALDAAGGGMGGSGSAVAAGGGSALPGTVEGGGKAAVGSMGSLDAAQGAGSSADATVTGAASGVTGASAPEVLVKLDAHFAPTGAGAAAPAEGASDATCVLRTLHSLLSEWFGELSARSDEEKRTARGKTATLTFQETTRNLQPLVTQLLTASVPADIFEHIVKIFRHIDNREYVAATDAYILAAIGNAPWPIGVTMVGIHTRAAREKIQTTHSAHVMNDETQRKYLQAIKRVITFAQKRHPTLPSQMVLHWNYAAASKEAPRAPDDGSDGAAP